ncbi:hypothetical protein [Anditalea andensis]|uniref:Outer membrane insertion C-signal n=1 Tax=Anditalea andensis TaxID=1048983 RepID=A0A074KYH7_9BACT|nr:hypothetical protein [Anditalea andensis]KEO73275.1 hypothetical protein EL17_13075 [Anditalea andensis]
MKVILLSTFLFLVLLSETNAQVSAAIYRFGSQTFAAIGSNPDNMVFGEARFSGNLEATLGVNLIRREEVNFYSGFHLGVESNRHNDFYLGVPFGLLVKPFTATRNFGFVLEFSPILIADNGYGDFRAGLGLKYTFR